MKLKHFFKSLFSGIYMTIQDGPLKGKKWIATSGGHFIKGDFEPYKTKAFLEHFTKDDVLYDIGGHIGYFSAIAATIISESNRIFAFEPRPSNADFFRRHMKANNFQQVQLFQTAIGEIEGEAKFNTNTGSATGHLDDKGDITVKIISVDKMFQEGKLPKPTFMKIDVEGGEIEVLKGCRQVIEQCKPKLLVATHDAEKHAYVVDFLQKNNYEFEILNQDGIKGDTEIMAVQKAS